jgi:hypothetical protein
LYDPQGADGFLKTNLSGEKYSQLEALSFESQLIDTAVAEKLAPINLKDGNKLMPMGFLSREFIDKLELKLYTVSSKNYQITPAW